MITERLLDNFSPVHASIFVGLGYKVDLINTQAQLLSYLDDEIADALSYYLRELGVLIRHQEQYEKVETFDDCVVLHLKSGKKIKAMPFYGVTVVQVILTAWA